MSNVTTQIAKSARLLQIQSFCFGTHHFLPTGLVTLEFRWFLVLKVNSRNEKKVKILVTLLSSIVSTGIVCRSIRGPS